MNKNKNYLKCNLNTEFNNKLLILFVGRLVEYKRCEIFIESILNLSRDSKNKIKALIIGDGEKKKN